MCTLCLLYVILCIQHVCNSLALPVKENLCKCMILLAFVTLFSIGCVCVCVRARVRACVYVCVSCLIKVNPCEAAGALLLCVPHPSLSFLHSATLLSLHPCSPSSWHSDSTGEYAPSRSHPPFLAPAGGVSLETVSELTGWVQIDGCPLSDYTTGPLKATRLDLWAWSHPSVLTRNGPFHLTRVNIGSTQAEGVCVCSFFLCIYIERLCLLLPMCSVCLYVCVWVCVWLMEKISHWIGHIWGEILCKCLPSSVSLWEKQNGDWSFFCFVSPPLKMMYQRNPDLFTASYCESEFDL